MSSVEEQLPLPTEVEEAGVYDVNPDQEVIPSSYEITSYGADFLVDGLVTRMSNGDIVIPTFDPETSPESEMAAFQRGFVWKKPQIDRFIESLLLGLPVPAIFLVREADNLLLVLDGQQRLRSLQAYYAGVLRGKEFRLEWVDSPYKGLAYKDLDVEDRRRLDNSIIHAIVVRQENPPNEYGSIYSIFERLNTGGTVLQPQEIRVALYRGSFVNLLRDLNRIPSWRNIYGPRSDRLKDQELILRFFAFYYLGHLYKRPIKGFLNRYVQRNRNLEVQGESDLRRVFERTTSVIDSAIGKQAFRPQRALNAAVLDSVMVGVARRLEAGPVADLLRLADAYNLLISSNHYLETVESSTAGEESVKTRLALATEAFASVP